MHSLYFKKISDCFSCGKLILVLVSLKWTWSSKSLILMQCCDFPPYHLHWSPPFLPSGPLRIQIRKKYVSEFSVLYFKIWFMKHIEIQMLQVSLSDVSIRLFPWWPSHPLEHSIFLPSSSVRHPFSEKGTF